MTFTSRIFCLYLGFLSYFSLGYIESKQWWTLRLWLSVGLHMRLFTVLVTVATLFTIYDITTLYGSERISSRISMATVFVCYTLLILRLLLPLRDEQKYIVLRWKAWTGPSRTGIAPSMTHYLGSSADWYSLLASCGQVHLDPIERFSRLTSGLKQGIVQDPSEILKKRLDMDRDLDTVWLPLSDVKTGVYAPSELGQPVSLLWGADAGFLPRCSRGIIAVPRNLLKFQPRLKNGVDGRPLCLAHGILARNKGLEPHNLICNLKTPARLQSFELNSALWPRPSKTLRSFYKAEMYKLYSGLGDSFVSAATELALLLADSRPEVIGDWLDTCLEHQDLSLNHQIANLGATADELSLLYRGQYIAMLVSLSQHRLGGRLRPELTVFKRLLEKQGAPSLPAWLAQPSLVQRQEQEVVLIGDGGMQLIDAAV